MGWSLYISFCDYPMLQPPVWIGFENYERMFREPAFYTVLRNTMLYAAIAIPAGTVTAVGLAVLLNQKVRGQAIFRTCIFLPTVVPLVATAVVWYMMLNPEIGLVNRSLRSVGIAGPLWWDRACWTMAALVLVSVWSIGSAVVIYLAGLQEIPQSLYEAAWIDGASRWRQFLHVTLPGLSPVILFNVIIGIIGTWQIFALPYVILRMGTGPDQIAYFYTTYLFESAFRDLKMGYASALAWVQLLIILVLTGLVFWVGKKRVYYRGG